MPLQLENSVQYGIDIGYLSQNTRFWPRVAATCTSEANPSHMTVYVGIPLNKLEGGMDHCHPGRQDNQNQNNELVDGEEQDHGSGLGGKDDLSKLLNDGYGEEHLALNGDNGGKC